MTARLASAVVITEFRFAFRSRRWSSGNRVVLESCHCWLLGGLDPLSMASSCDSATATCARGARSCRRRTRRRAHDARGECIRRGLDLARAGVALHPDLDQRVDPAHLGRSRSAPGSRSTSEAWRRGCRSRPRRAAERTRSGRSHRPYAGSSPGSGSARRRAGRTAGRGRRWSPRATPSLREREHETDDGADEEAADGEPPAPLDALPGRGEIDLLLAFELGRGAAVVHRLATLSAAQRH